MAIKINLLFRSTVHFFIPGNTNLMKLAVSVGGDVLVQ